MALPPPKSPQPPNPVQTAQKPEAVVDDSYRHIVRVVNTDLDGKKQLLYALTKIRGISYQFANAVCHLTGISQSKKAGDLTDKEVEKLDAVIKAPAQYTIPAWMYNRRKDYETGADKHLFGTDIKFIQDGDIRIMKKIKCYRGVRHSLGLPVRGQRTRSNFRKNKGKVLGVIRKAVGAPKPAEEGKEKK